MKHSLQHREEMHEDTPVPLDIKGEIEIEYEYTVRDYFKNGLADLKMKATISYHLFEMGPEDVHCHYYFVGSTNYLPSNFEQLMKDYLGELPEMRGKSINKFKIVTK